MNALHPVASPQVNQGPPPKAFLDNLIDAIGSLPDEIFAPNSVNDIYSYLAGVLGPWQSLQQRRAVMYEALRVLAGFESSWNWEEGVDTSPGAGYGRPMDEWESGAFQVSHDSIHADGSLATCVTRIAGAADVQTFLDAMKSSRSLAVEYCARLLRFRISWSGPINRGWIRGAVWPPAVNEFQNFLSSAGSPSIAVVRPGGGAAPVGGSIRGIDTSTTHASIVPGEFAES